MDAYKAIITKRDTRTYTDEPVPEEALRRILQAGRMAGSSKNTQPVRLVALQDKAWMQEVATCGKFSEPLKAASAAIAICCAPDGSDFDAGRAAQNIMVSAWNEGIASCPTSVHDQACGTGKLRLPEGWRVVVIVALGHPDPNVPMSLNAKRRPWEEYVRWERWE
jgi:nitroreductase